MEKRKYTMRKRAEAQDETRQRIVEATMALHEELGPRNTTISAIAERAGVQRLTVYRHFADEMALFQACTSCWLERHPPPPVPQSQSQSELESQPESQPHDVPEPAAERTRAALRALYRYYGQTRRMLEVSYRDVDLVPALQAPMQGIAQYLDAYRDAILACWRTADDDASRTQRLRATLTVAVRFETWRTLADLGLGDDAMAALATGWVAAIGADGSGAVDWSMDSTASASPR